MKEEGQLTVEFKDRNSRFSCIQVSDSGTGLPEIKDNIFLPYVSLKEGGDHWGMGLYYCQRAMHLHGGQIRADNNKDKGAVFTLWFPKNKKMGFTGKWKIKKLKQ